MLGQVPLARSHWLLQANGAGSESCLQTWRQRRQRRTPPKDVFIALRTVFKNQPINEGQGGRNNYISFEDALRRKNHDQC